MSSDIPIGIGLEEEPHVDSMGSRFDTWGRAREPHLAAFTLFLPFIANIKIEKVRGYYWK